MLEEIRFLITEGILFLRHCRKIIIMVSLSHTLSHALFACYNHCSAMKISNKDAACVIFFTL